MLASTPWLRHCCTLSTVLVLILLGTVSAYQILISDSDAARQVCSGMWGPGGGSRDPWIEVIFAPNSRGQLALIIYEWTDARYIGVDADGSGSGQNTWEDERVYVCTVDAYRAKLCNLEQIGEFIIAADTSSTSESTSIFTTAVRFDSRALAPSDDAGSSNSSAPLAINSGPFRYEVKKTGYYCVGAIPVSISTSSSGPDSTTAADSTPSTSYSSYTGVVDFENIHEGHLPAAEYPKIWFYTGLAVVYAIMGVAWAALCFKHRREILPIQHYVSATIVFIVIEMLALSGYYRYLNSSGSATLDRVYLTLVALLNAARNSISFFMLLIVCMGYGVVRPSLGSVMIRVRILAVVHFIFGVMYSIGIVTIPIESAGIFIFFFVFPLAFSLTAFMMWIMFSLNATILDLETRKQSFKKQLFTRLYRILVGALIVIAAFFVITSMSFSNRLDEDYVPDTWQNRWWMLDGWLGILYLVCFAAIAWLWTPNDNNRRLAMSDELATDEADADEFEVDTLRDDRLEAEEGAYSKSGPPSGYGGVGRDEVVFDIGDENDSDEEGDVGRQAEGSSKSKGKERRSEDDLEHGRDSQEGQRLTGRGNRSGRRRSDSSERADTKSLPPAYDN